MKVVLVYKLLLRWPGHATPYKATEGVILLIFKIGLKTSRNVIWNL